MKNFARLDRRYVDQDVRAISGERRMIDTSVSSRGSRRPTDQRSWGAFPQREIRGPVRHHMEQSGTDAIQIRRGAERLRRADIVAATLPRADAQSQLAVARAWGYHALLLLARTGSIRLVRVSDGSTQTLSNWKPEVIRRFVRANSGTDGAGTRAED